MLAVSSPALTPQSWLQMRLFSKQATNYRESLEERSQGFLCLCFRLAQVQWEKPFPTLLTSPNSAYCSRRCRIIPGGARGCTAPQSNMQVSVQFSFPECVPYFPKNPLKARFVNSFMQHSSIEFPPHAGTSITIVNGRTASFFQRCWHQVGG